MSLDYIKSHYQVPANEGQRVEYTGGAAPREGVITGADGARLLIKLDGESQSRRYHPTWELRYLTDSQSGLTTTTTPAADALDLRSQIMNLQCKPYDGTDAYTPYCNGHRDARHAAAELATVREQQHALQLLSLDGQAMERESALVAERDALRAALVADAEFAKALTGHEEYCERAYAEGWDSDPTGSSHLASSAYRVSAMRIKAEEMKAAALALAAPAVEG